MLALDLVEVGDLVFRNNKVLSRLSSILGNMLLFLVEFVDHLILVGNLIIEVFDGVVTVGLLLLNLLNGHLNILNVLLDGSALLLQKLLISSGLLTGLLLSDKSLLGVVHLNLSHQSLLLLLNGLVLSKQPVLGLQLLIVLAPGGRGLGLQKLQLLLRVGHANEAPGLLDDHKPSPVPAGQVLSKLPLGNLDQLPLVKLLCVHLAADPLEDLTLDETDPLDDQLVTLLLETTEGSRTEEDKSV